MVSETTELDLAFDWKLGFLGMHGQCLQKFELETFEEKMRGDRYKMNQV